MKQLTILLLSLIIIGCVTTQPMMFGVPADQWSRLTKEQQDEVIRGYNQRQATEAANAPLINAIQAAAQAVEQDQRRKQLNNMSNNPSGFRTVPGPQYPQFPASLPRPY